MSAEQVDQRVLAAVRFVHMTTGAPITSGLTVEGEGRWAPNRSGLWVLHAHPALEAYRNSFASPVPAPLFSLRAVVRAQGDVWMARAFTISLPRPSNGANPALFQAIDITLAPSTATAVQRSWAAVRVAVRMPGAVPVEGAVVRVLQGTALRAQSHTNTNGEALALIAGIPLFTAAPSGDAVTVPGVDHRVQIVVDRASNDPATGLRRRSPTDPSAHIVDPDDTWARRAAFFQSSRVVSLSHGAGRSLVFELA